MGILIGIIVIAAILLYVVIKQRGNGGQYE